jgi:subtilisin family serine protease
MFNFKPNHMKNKITLFLVSSFLFCGYFVKAQETNIQPGDLIVLLRSTANVGQLCADLKTLNGKETQLQVVKTLSKSMNIFLLHFDEATISQQQMLNAIKINRNVLIAQNNHIFQERVTVPNDAQFGVMWDMDNIGQSGGTPDADIDAPEAWDITTGGLTAQGDTIVVAVIDGGFKLNHVDLNFFKNYNEIPGNGIDDDGNGYIDDFKGWYTVSNNDNIPTQTHGTHVAGTVGAKGNNTIGVTGVNWNVKVMPISYGSGGSGFEANVVEAYGYARDMRRLYDQTSGAKGAFVVATNSSFGVDLAQPSSYPLWCAMYDSLGAVGILSAGATANANYNVDVQGDIPTACPSNWLITVTNTTRNDTKATAGYGANTIDLGAPGSNITSTYYTGSTDTYSAISGTSMATPHVAGTVGLMMSVACTQFIADYKANPSAIALVVKDSILNATDPISALNGITLTGGRLNLYKSVKSIQNYCLSTTINEATQENLDLFGIYPNPASGYVSVAYASTTAVLVEISNVLGQKLKQIQEPSTSGTQQHVRIDISDLTKGTYFLSVVSSNQTSKVYKMIVY